MEVSAYEPVSLTENDWEKVRAFVRVVVEKAKADPNSPYSAKNLMGHVTAHVAWCHRIAGLPLEVSVVFDRDIIGEACERAFPSLTTGTRHSQVRSPVRGPASPSAGSAHRPVEAPAR